MNQSCNAGTIGMIEALGRAQAAVGAAQRELLRLVAGLDLADVWRADGCRDMAQWLSGRLGISDWAARRWINAAHALEFLPLTGAALEAGTLSLDKVVELARLASPDTEARLLAWAKGVSAGAIRRRADVAARPSQEDAVAAHRSRFLRYWWLHDEKMMGLEGMLPADQGAVVAKALDRLAGRIPDIIEDDETIPSGSPYEDTLDERRADALVAMASRAIADDQDPDRATVVVHAGLDALEGDGCGCEIEGGPVIHPETARRLSCDARLEFVVHDRDGNAVGIGRASRNPPPHIVRQLRYRDKGCTFPGCGRRWFLHAHHIVHWGKGGPTNLDNLVLACTFHHKLVHELGWGVALGDCGTATWFRPDGRRYDPASARPGALLDRAPPALELEAVA